MSVFKAVYGILKKNLGTLIIGLVISVGISMAYSTNSTNTDLRKSNVVVFNHDQGDLAKSLQQYMKDVTKSVELKEEQQVIDDALFFSEVDYVLTIPKNFTADIQAKKQPKLAVQAKADTFNQTYIDSLVNTYLSTYQFYKTAFPEKKQQELLAMTKKDATVEGKVVFDHSFNKLEKTKAAGSVYNILAYTLVMTIFSTITLVTVIFNRSEIRTRNSCSPLSKQKFSRQLLLTNFVFSLIIWLIFSITIWCFTSLGMSQHSFYFTINTLLLFIVAVSFGNFVGGILTSVDMITAVNNIFILGSSFISGVFISADILPDIVIKVASFTPSYWYVKNNALIGNAVVFDSVFVKQFQFQSFLLLLFAILFFLLSVVSKREKGGVKITWFKKEVLNG